MIIKILLILILLMIGFYFFSNRRTANVQAIKKILLLLIFSVGVISVLFAEYLNHIAKTVGVGRGADLMFYLFILSFIFIFTDFYLKQKDSEKKLNTVIRKLSLLERKIQEMKNSDE